MEADLPGRRFFNIIRLQARAEPELYMRFPFWHAALVIYGVRRGAKRWAGLWQLGYRKIVQSEHASMLLLTKISLCPDGAACELDPRSSRIIARFAIPGCTHTTLRVREMWGRRPGGQLTMAPVHNRCQLEIVTGLIFIR